MAETRRRKGDNDDDDDCSDTNMRHKIIKTRTKKKIRNKKSPIVLMFLTKLVNGFFLRLVKKSTI